MEPSSRSGVILKVVPGKTSSPRCALAYSSWKTFRAPASCSAQLGVRSHQATNWPKFSWRPVVSVWRNCQVVPRLWSMLLSSARARTRSGNVSAYCWPISVPYDTP